MCNTWPDNSGAVCQQATWEHIMCSAQGGNITDEAPGGNFNSETLMGGRGAVRGVEGIRSVVLSRRTLALYWHLLKRDLVVI